MIFYCPDGPTECVSILISICTLPGSPVHWPLQPALGVAAAQPTAGRKRGLAQRGPVDEEHSGQQGGARQMNSVWFRWRRGPGTRITCQEADGID